MLNDHKILMNIKFHRTSMTPCFNMKMENIENTLEVFINNFKILSKKYAKNQKKEKYVNEKREKLLQDDFDSKMNEIIEPEPK